MDELLSPGTVPSAALRNGSFIVARNRVFELVLRPLVLKRSADVATGTVKWFNAMKGYGFIQPDKGGKDVFVHISAVEKAGFTGLAEGAKISYEIVSDRGKDLRSENLPDRPDQIFIGATTCAHGRTTEAGLSTSNSGLISAPLWPQA